MARPIAQGVRVYRRRWRQDGVSMDEVRSQLDRLTAELAHEIQAASDNPRSLLTCCMNMVVRPTRGRAQVEEARGAISELALSQPLRVVLVNVRQTGAGLSAELLCEARAVPGSAPLLLEEVLLTVGAEPARRLVQLVSPVLAAGDPVLMWWMGTPPLDDSDLVADLRRCDALVVDLAVGDPLPAVARGLALLAGRPPVADLEWPRQRACRETLAGFFAAADRRRFVHAVDRLDVEAGRPSSAALLVGWLASRLGYQLEGASPGPGGEIRATYRNRDRRTVDVRLRLGGDVPLRRIGIEGGRAGRRFELELRIEAPPRATLSFHIERTVIQPLVLETPGMARLLAEVRVEARRDTVYPEALSAAADLLEKLP